MTGTIHMLCGYIGAGKTTFARQLEQQANGFRFNLDLAMVTLFGINPPREYFELYRPKIEELHLIQAARLLQIGVDVIFDYGFWGRDRRDFMRDFAARNNAQLKMYYISAPEKIMRERAVCRHPGQDGETLEIIPETWNSLRQHFEPPDPDEEDFIQIDGTTRHLAS